MKNIVIAGFIAGVLISTLACNLIAAAASTLDTGYDDGTLPFIVDPEEYENLGADFWPSVILKRSSFWSPHPSDYNPMRRPGPSPRNLKRTPTDRNHPYHPIPRAIAMNQRSSSSTGFTDELEEGKEKRQTRTAAWLFHLGPLEYASAKRKAEGLKYVPSEARSNLS